MRRYIEQVVADCGGKKLAAIAGLEIAWSTYFRMKKRWAKASGQAEESLVRDRR